MSTGINTSDIQNFFIKNFSSNKISVEDAKKLGVDVASYEYADENDDNAFDISEIAKVKDLYAAFVSVVQKEADAVETKDADQEKAEETKVKQKGEAKQ